MSRQAEREHLPLARELGIALCPFHPSALGFLSGRYQRAEESVTGQGRIQEAQGTGNPIFGKFTSDRSWRILDGLLSVARELERPPAEVALNWAATRPGVGSTLLGASTPAQLDLNLGALDVDLPVDAIRKLDALSEPEETELQPFFGPVLQSMVNGKSNVRRLEA